VDDNPSDKGARYVVKLDPAGVLAWLLQVSPSEFHFEHWLDTRGVPFPGEPDRWSRALKGWKVMQSRQVLEWQAETRAEGKSEMLLTVIEERFGILSSDLRATVAATTDAARLRNLAALALRA
jgi:hypothetical protein